MELTEASALELDLLIVVRRRIERSRQLAKKLRFSYLTLEIVIEAADRSELPRARIDVKV
jgi:hypothetical protein